MAFAFGVNLILLSGIIAPAGPLSPVLGWILACAAVLFSLFDVTRIVLKSRADPVKSR